MKKFLKYTLIIFAFIMLISVNKNAKAATYGKLTYKVQDDGTIIITGCDRDVSGNLTIPSEIDGRKVTSIGDWAFYNRSSLTDITIPDSVTSIDKYAFLYCSSLTNINVSNDNKVYSSEDGVLFNKDKTKIIQYPEGKKSTSYTIPNSVTSIGEGAFYNCSSLTNISIPNSVTSIGDGTFVRCSSLTDITIPNSVTSIGDEAFDACSSLTNINVSNDNKVYSSEDGVLFNKDKTEITRYPEGKKSTSYTIPNSVNSIGGRAFAFCSSLKNITIPNSVTSIGNGAFAVCSSLKNITIPNSVTSIGDGTFVRCSSLTNITIPNSVTSIGDEAFNFCSSLTNIDVSNDNKVYSSEDGVLFNKDKTKIIKYPEGKKDTSYTIPNSVTSIGARVFKNCSSLTNITIPNSVTSIDEFAFQYCSSLKKVLCFGNNVTLENEAFSNCPSDMKIYAKNGLEGYDKNGWEKYSGNIVRYNEALKQPTITFKSRNQTEKVELADDNVFKSLVAISSYSVENSGVVSVDGYLNEKPKKNGTTFVNINVKYKDGPEVTLKQNVDVDVKSTGVKLSDSNITFTNKNNLTKKLTATVLPQDSAFQDVTWKSSDTNIATVDNEGNVTAKGRGTCKITATTTDGYNSVGTCNVTVDVKAEEISLDKTEYKFTTVEKMKLTPSFVPSVAKQNVKWTSTNEKVATVDSNGNITPLKYGRCRIRATTIDGTNLTAECIVDVGVPASKIYLEKNSVTITSTKQKENVRATVEPVQAFPGATYKSSDTKVAKVGGGGNITPVGNGICKITATTVDGTNLTSSSCNVTVAIKSTGVKLSEKNISFTNKTNLKKKLTAIVLPQESAFQDVIWKSSNTNIATVDENGTVTAVGSGTCKITATTKDGYNSVGTCEVIVDIKTEDISMDKTSYIFSKAGSVKLTATVSPKESNKNLKWSSSDEKVAKVNNDGTVTAVGSGTCKITATTVDGTNLSVSCNIKVDIKAEKISLNKTSYTFNEPRALELTATVQPKEASKNLKWTSSDEKVAKVTTGGVVVPVGKGSCKITVETTDGTNLSAGCSITSNITYIRGDITRDGKVDMEDVYTAVKRLARGTLSDEDKLIIEVTNDGRVDMEDIYKMLKYIAGKITVL